VDIRRRYIVAATPRTGSSLLCEGLGACCVAGRPAEVFAPDFRDPWYARWGVPRHAPFRRYFDAALRYGTSANGIYGIKIQWMHVPVLAMEVGHPGPPGEVLDQLFPDALYVNIIRQDRRAQAISWYRACETNEWFRTASTLRPNEAHLQVNVERVLYLERHLEHQQSQWEWHFRQRGIRPHVVEYDQLVQDYQGVVGRVLAYLELDPLVSRSIPNPHLMRQGDAKTDAWRRQVDAEVGRPAPAGDGRGRGAL
jgi:trehalose 2-sulfotransferase